MTFYNSKDSQNDIHSYLYSIPNKVYFFALVKKPANYIAEISAIEE
jgi:hypothetical protein